MENIHFSAVTEAEVPELLNIYNYFILHSTATYHTVPLTETDMRRLLNMGDKKYKSFTIRHHDDICGYILFTAFIRRQACDTTAEVTLYLKPEFAGRGIGTVALQFIELQAKISGIQTLIALVCGENSSSIRLFEKNGYFKCAHYQKIAEKFSRKLDLLGFEKHLS